METSHSLLSTRQLTEYRDWPDGRQGCLFYVARNETDAEAGIYLVDTPCRKEDQPGEFNQLHRAELKALKEKKGILTGALADIFCHCAATNPDYRSECWNLYWTPYLRGFWFEDQFPFLLMLCREWLAADKQILSAYPDADLVRDFRNSFLRFTRTMLDNVAKSDDLML